MVGLLLIGLAQGAECSLDTSLSEAETAILSLDLEGGQSALAAAREALSCGPAASEAIAKYWLLRAAHADYSGDPEGVPELLRAARAASATFYLDSLGPDLRERWATTVALVGDARFQFADLPDGYTISVDGRDASDRTLAPGFHVVQAAGGDNGWGLVVRASAGDVLQLSTGLPELERRVLEPDPPDEPKPRPERDPGPVALHVAVGLSGVFGDAYGAEPSTKVGPLVEVGLRIRPVDAVWLRAAVGGDVLVGGAWSYAGADGPTTLPVGPAVLAAGGLVLSEQLDVGLLTGMQLPGRIPVRALAAVHPHEHLGGELRAGVNLGTPDVDGLRIEPAVSLHATLTL